MTFGDTLKLLRKKHGYTQEELAKMLGIACSTVSMYERGERTPDLEMLKFIANIFGVDMNYLSGLQEKPAENGEPSENVIIYHRDGKNVKREFTKEQMDMLVSMIEAIPEKPKDI